MPAASPDNGAERTARLASLREQHPELDAAFLAELTGRDRKSAYRWLGGKEHAIPEPVLRLVEMTFAQKARS